MHSLDSTSKRKGHVGMFPSYFTKNFQDHKLAILDGNKLTLENGVVIYVVSFENLLECMFTKKIMIFTASFMKKETFPFLKEFVYSDKSEVSCDKKGKVTCIRIKFGNYSRWISNLKIWDLDPEFESLLKLRELFDYMEVGTAPTPSSIGGRTMIKSWYENQLDKHTMPGGDAVRFIREHMTGGRVDTPMQGEFLDVADHYDMSSAYCRFFSEEKPTGTAIPFQNWRSSFGLKDWFAKVRIRIVKDLSLGPFPVRNYGGILGSVGYPKSPGIYTSYLWKCQAEDVLMSSCEVDILQGYGWIASTRDNYYWARDIFTKRVEASDSDLVKRVKKIIVSAIGRHGTGDTFYRLVPEGEESQLDVQLCDDDGNAYAYFVQEVKNVSSTSMIHWYSQTISLCSSSLYNFALPHANDGSLAASNYDSVITLHRPSISANYPVKGSDEALLADFGSWIYQELTNLYIKNPRTFICDQMNVQPGVKRKGE